MASASASTLRTAAMELKNTIATAASKYAWKRIPAAADPSRNILLKTPHPISNNSAKPYFPADDSPSHAETRASDPLDAIRASVRQQMQQRQKLNGLAPTPSSSKVALLGGPGVGKGTWGSLIAQRLSIPHISTGDLVRKELAKPLSSCSPKETLLHAQVKEAMTQGKLLPDAVMVELLLARLRETDPSVGFVLDGFPRTIAQAATLDDAMAQGGIDLALNFHLEEDVLVAKCLGRRVCKHCGKDYNLAHVDIVHRHDDQLLAGAGLPHRRTFLPARLPPPECASELTARADDSNEAVVRERLRVYARESKPLEQYYRAQDKLVDVDVGPGAEYVWSRLTDIVGDLEGKLETNFCQLVAQS